MDDFIFRALLAGLGVALVAGPMGCFVVWRKMAYFGDTLAHGALLGVVVGTVFNFSLNAGIAAVSLLIALILAGAQGRRWMSDDTLLGILSHGALALGIVTISLTKGGWNVLSGYLFGDVLAVSENDLIWIYVTGALIVSALAFLWRPLLALTAHEELARVEGVHVGAVRAAYMALLALFVALAMKVVGVLLVTALLILPAATIRKAATSPEMMALLAALAGCLSVAGGLWGAFSFDIPAGPGIVVAALALFLLSSVLPSFRKRR
jgi:zinc transport system permease protein